MLRTPRLDLIAGNLEHIEAELSEPNRIGARLGVTVPEGWPPGEFDRDAMVYFRSRLTAGNPGQAGWFHWYGIARGAGEGAGTLVVAAGYFGPPENGRVEIGYSVVPSARRQGYATEMVAALVERALAEPSVMEVVAHTTDANGASTRVLLGCGFQRVGPGAEPGAILYQRNRTE